MFDRHRSKIAALGAALVAAMAFGGAAIASNSKPAPKAHAASTASTAGKAAETPGQETADGNTAEAPGQETADGKDTDSVKAGDQTAPDSTTGAPEQESGSEQPGNDGPGGHADEPANPNADHQFEGVE